MRLFFVTYAATGANLATASVFEAKHAVKASILISFLRSLLLLLPVTFIMNQFDLLWLSVPLTELIVLPIAIALWKRESSKNNFKIQTS